jgi:hypothetical protein
MAAPLGEIVARHFAARCAAARISFAWARAFAQCMRPNPR